jgi:hypothetical protein
VDKLVKVWRKDGVEEWVLIHVEIQHTSEDEFSQRMFVYYYRLLDRYNRKVASLAVLGDDRADWRPDRYNSELWDCEVVFRFPIVKLLDWAEEWQALESDSNPFAIVVLTDLKGRETQKDPQSRKEWKFRIVRGLFERGLDREDIRQLFRFIDWVMELPEPQALAFEQEVSAYEKEKAMPYVTSIERHGIEKGERKGLLAGIKAGLKIKFGTAGLACMRSVRKVEELKTLESLLNAIERTATVAEFRALLD